MSPSQKNPAISQENLQKADVERIKNKIVPHVKNLLSDFLDKAEYARREADGGRARKMHDILENADWQFYWADTQNEYVCYKDALVIRYPKNDDPKTLSIQIQVDRPDSEVAFDAGSMPGFKDGFYVMSDGKIVLTTPKDGTKIAILSLANPGDTPLQYRC